MYPKRVTVLFGVHYALEESLDRLYIPLQRPLTRRHASCSYTLRFPFVSKRPNTQIIRELRAAQLCGP